MGKVGVSLANTHVRCAKPGCDTGSRAFNRHHLGHQYMFAAAFASTRLNEPRYKRFVERYYEYAEADTVLVCVPHHVEIHCIYDPIIQKHLKVTGKGLRRYSWAEATDLIERLISRGNQWLKVESPGIQLDMSNKKRLAQGGFHNLVQDLKRKGII